MNVMYSGVCTYKLPIILKFYSWLTKKVIKRVEKPKIFFTNFEA